MNPEIEQAVNRGLKKLGKNSFLRVLNYINNKMHFNPGLEFQFIENIICQYFGVKSKDLYGASNNMNTVNCRKMITYMLIKHTDMESGSICYLMQINGRTLRRYRKQMFGLLHMPQSLGPRTIPTLNIMR